MTPEEKLIMAEKIGAEIRRVRLDRGITQAHLAKLTGIKRPNVARAENGRHLLTLETLVRLGKALGVTAASLVAAGERDPEVVYFDGPGQVFPNIEAACEVAAIEEHENGTATVTLRASDANKHPTRNVSLVAIDGGKR